MKLHHWRPPPEHGTTVTNFGDELNTMLWPQLLGPSFFDDDDRVAFLGIGSLLGWPKDGDATRRHRLVVGTGAAFADAAVREPVAPNWRVYCVRGPLTARAYELDPSLAVTDPAILVARSHRRADPSVDVGFMPHLHTAIRWSDPLSSACADIGVRYIDPRHDVDAVLGSVASVSLMVTEAMHGAIVADALRIPWVPVYGTGRPHVFKWTDWCTSMGVEFRPRRVVDLSYWSGRIGVRGRAVDLAAGRLFGARIRHLAGSGPRSLSADDVHRQRLEQLDEAVERLQTDVRAGRFAVPENDRARTAGGSSRSGRRRTPDATGVPRL